MQIFRHRVLEIDRHPLRKELAFEQGVFRRRLVEADLLVAVFDRFLPEFVIAGAKQEHDLIAGLFHRWEKLSHVCAGRRRPIDDVIALSKRFFQ